MINIKAGLVTAAFLLAGAITQGQQPTDQTAEKAVWVASGSLYIIIPADRSGIVAYSTATSKLVSIKCDPPLPQDAEPVVGSSTAFVQAGRTVYAVGTHSENWAKLTLPRDGMTPVVDGACVRVSDDASFFIFGSAANEWTGIDLKNGQPIGTQNGG